MGIIKVENNYSWLVSNNEKAKELIWKAMRFRQRGGRYNQMYVSRQWDGYTDFFKKGTGRFLTGLLPEIEKALRYLNIEYEIQDFRNPFEFITDQVDEKWLGESISLRDYQVDYINQALRNKRGIIPSPTSSGKTLMMVGILKAVSPKTPTLILANRIDLVEQNYEEIVKYGIQNVGRYYGKVKEPNYITCCTIQSAEALIKVLPKIKVVMVDEIHDMMSKKCKAVYKELVGASVRVAMSATWQKFGGTDLVQKYEVKGWIGPEFYSSNTETGRLTTKELQERDILSTAECAFFEVTEPELLYDVYLDAVTRGIAENEHFHKIVVSLMENLPGRSLVMVERIAHGDRLQELIPGALWVRGKDNTKTRKEIINTLKVSKERTVAIATSGIFNTGINVFIHNLVNAAGGQADHQIIQRFGRGLRVASDKEHLKYYDFFFKINQYLEKHSKKRIRILTKEGHKVKCYKTIQDLFGA